MRWGTLALVLVLIFLFLSTTGVHVSSAKEIQQVSPTLVQLSARSFPDAEGQQAKKSWTMEGRGGLLHFDYTSDAAFTLRAAFPLTSLEDERMVFNPLHMLEVKLMPAKDENIAIALTGSPAWSPGRAQYYFEVAATSGAVVTIENVRLEEVPFFRVILVSLRHFLLDEPPLVSSVNFLWGYRVLDRSVSLLLGALLGVLGFVFILRKRDCTSVLVLCLIFVMLYEARFSYDLLRQTIADLKGWYGGKEYRMLGPLPEVESFLLSELHSASDQSMKVAVCYEGLDLPEKHLRYALYPVPVVKAQEGGDASHAVLLHASHAKIDDGVVWCGEHLGTRGEILRTFPKNAHVIRFTDAS